VCLGPCVVSYYSVSVQNRQSRVSPSEPPNCAILAESRKGGAFDLRAGTISLPVVLGIQSNPELAAMFGKQRQFEGTTFDRALQLIRDP
jgi:hypothetical protein